MADTLGGALFNAGELFVKETSFSENAAGGEGLAIYNYGSSIDFLDATFDGNIKSCPSGEYSALEEASIRDDYSIHEILSIRCFLSMICCILPIARIPSSAILDIWHYYYKC